MIESPLRIAHGCACPQTNRRNYWIMPTLARITKMKATLGHCWGRCGSAFGKNRQRHRFFCPKASSHPDAKGGRPPRSKSLSLWHNLPNSQCRHGLRLALRRTSAHALPIASSKRRRPARRRNRRNARSLLDRDNYLNCRRTRRLWTHLKAEKLFGKK